ncbi:ClbS/DfsB family four-helix bundle protein [Micropruina sonneratiae]|uniref:ClbS/DfsB family four-helix bundle protein n=1 Tax=Micropruina sonneratiae TaxID=2986940 RepID=UPI0022270AE5|nr:ClbS/DfsB family four-helix bundle protein [Micropruina sp. KQZ13P-5]MCW3157392.1 ClbS/DfsB family four-helix bundle protein [Micropruina sp. KQZ13P-5]
MGIPTTKADLLAVIDDGYRRLCRELARVPAERAAEPTMQGHVQGTTMSPSDLVGYLIGWNETVLYWLAEQDAGRQPAFPAPGFGWDQLGELAQHFYARSAGRSWPELLGDLAAAKDRIVGLVEGLDDDALYGRPWYATHTLGRMIQFNSSSPYANARRRLQAWLRQQAPGAAPNLPPG